MASSDKRVLAAASACGSLSDLRRIHGFLIRNRDRIRNPSLLFAKLLRFAAVSPAGDLPYAARLCFHGLPHVPARARTFFYNTLLRGLARSPSPSRALALFRLMRRRGVPPDHFSLTFVIKARAGADARPGDVHGLALKLAFLGPSNPHSHNALIHLYVAGDPAGADRLIDEMPDPDPVAWTGLIRARFAAGDPAGARRAFDRMPSPDVVAWSAMIDGYVKLGRPAAALALFRAMPPHIPPDEVTLIGVAAACAAAGDARTGAAVDRYAGRTGLSWMTSLRNALITMYGRLGAVAEAERVFEETWRRDSATWSAMVGVYAAAGDAEGALRTVRRAPAADGGAFLAAMSACARAGRVEEGKELLRRMEREGVGATAEHYGCVVDMLGRAGRLEEAYRVAVEAEEEGKGSHVAWGAVLGGCRIHGDVEMAERVVGEVVRRRPDEGGYYLLLVGIYVEAGRVDEAEDVKGRMRQRGAPKVRACSMLSFVDSALDS